MKKVSLVLFLVAFVFFPATTFAQAELANGIAAIVNDSIITYEDVRNSIGEALKRVESQYQFQPKKRKQKRQEVIQDGIEELVERKLILHEFENEGHSLPESYIEETIQSRIRERYGDRLTLIKTLQAQGKTMEGYKSRIREQIIVDAMRRRKIDEEIIVSPHKIEQYYKEHKEEYKVQKQVKLHVLVLDKGKHGENARPLAEEIVKKLDAGVSFAEMARIYSDGSQASEGGSWGWVERSTLRKELADLAFSLKPGERSSIIENSDACYIIKVDARRPAHVQPLSEVRDQIVATLKAQERKRLQKQWIDQLKEESFVRYF